MPDPGSPAQPPADGAAPPPGGAAQSSGGAAQSSAAQSSAAQSSAAQPSGVQPPPGARPRRPSDGPTRVADQPTVVQRLIVRYAKRSRMRFASHRDIARAFERGVRRARLPIAYSAGFTPHPKISYAGAAPTGTASEAEYLELSLTATCVVAEVRDRLNAALPDGIDVIDVTEEAGSLGAVTFEASQWEVALPGVGRDEAAAAAETFLAQDSVEVERLTSKGMRRMDARAAVVTLQAGWCPADERDAGYAILRMVVRHLTPAVRPDDILTALRRVAGLVPSSPPLVTRLVQGPLVAVAAAAGPAGQHVPAGPTEASSAVTAPPSRGVTPLGPQSAGQGAAQTHVKTTRLGARSAALAGPPSASAYDQLPRGAEGSERTHAPGSLTGDSPDARNRAQRFTAERDSARQ
jgi:radical SAM-linked protein